MRASVLFTENYTMKGAICQYESGPLVSRRLLRSFYETNEKTERKNPEKRVIALVFWRFFIRSPKFSSACLNFYILEIFLTKILHYKVVGIPTCNLKGCVVNYLWIGMFFRRQERKTRFHTKRQHIHDRKERIQL